MAPPRKRKSHDSSDDLGFYQGLDSFCGERMARRLKRKGIIAPQTVPINPVEEWDDDLREFMQSFDPSVVADYGCEDGVGVSGNTRTHNVVEDSTRVSSDNVCVESLDMDRDHNDGGFYNDEFLANAEDSPIQDVGTDVDDDDDNGFIDDLDPQYMVFLANLVEGGSSYVLQVALGNGRSITVNYEPVDGPVQECNPVDVVDTPIVCSSGTKTLKEMRSGTREGRTEPLCDSRKDTVETQRKSSSIPFQKRKKSLVERSEKAAADHVASRVKGDSSKRATPGLNNRDHQREVSMVDLSYQSFLGALRRDGNQTVFMSGINEEMLYEQNEESTSDSDVILLDGIVAPIVIPDDDGTVGVQNESSKFREGLMEILKKPYGREEHDGLRKDMRHRRPREQIHRLCSGDKSYSTNFMAKSYLDLHPDLQSQIVSAKLNEPKILRKDTMETQRKSSSIPVQKRKKSLVERSEKAAADHVASRVKGDSSKRATPGLNNRDHQREVSIVDLSCQSFLGALRRDGNQTVFMSGINEESTSDSEVILLDRIVAPVVILDDDGTVGVQNESSEFREGLMEILNKPYSQEEHDRLRKDICHQRPREQFHHLRSGDKSYPTKFLAESYLDLHPDLQSQIASAKLNKPKILNLLRGFFYWLICKTRGPSFRPWLDASCLAVQPPQN